MISDDFYRCFPLGLTAGCITHMYIYAHIRTYTWHIHALQRKTPSDAFCSSLSQRFGERVGMIILMYQVSLGCEFRGWQHLSNSSAHQFWSAFTSTTGRHENSDLLKSEITAHTNAPMEVPHTAWTLKLASWNSWTTQILPQSSHCTCHVQKPLFELTSCWQVAAIQHLINKMLLVRGAPLVTQRL